MFMRIVARKKLGKVPRNFRLHPELNKKLIAHGHTFKDGDRVGETGIVEAALESYFQLREVKTTPVSPVNSSPESHNNQQASGKPISYLKDKLRRKKTPGIP